MKYNIIIFFLLIFFMSFSVTAVSGAQETSRKHCEAGNYQCLIDRLKADTAEIEQTHWRDSTYRELAKILVHKGQTGDAVALIDKITSPDTKAMTIRAIGMTAAERAAWSDDKYDALFEQLMLKAKQIEHPPSYAIALTYIAMAQALAGDNDGAMNTAAMMENDALRNKAYAESAEIQAENGDLDAVNMSLSAMDDPAFRDKAYRTVSKIFADQKAYDKAYQAAEAIVTPYHRAQALLYILVEQTTPEEVSIE